MLLEAGAKHVIAVELSDAFEVLCRNILDPEKVTCLKIMGDQLPAYVIWIIFLPLVYYIYPIPNQWLKLLLKHYAQGGRFLVWLYGKEGDNLSSMTSLTPPMPNIIRGLKPKNYF